MLDQLAASDPEGAHTQGKRLVRWLLSLLVHPVDAGWLTGQLGWLCRRGHLDIDTWSEQLEKVLCDDRLPMDAGRRSTYLTALAKLNRPERFVACLDNHLAKKPSSAVAAAQYLGNAAFAAYRCGEDRRFAELTGHALDSAPDGYTLDWLLCNRAFASLLRGQVEIAWEGYVRAIASVDTQERWQKVALDDLEKHHERRPGAEPISPEFIARVRALWASRVAAE
jgi:hypothetical protein